MASRRLQRSVEEIEEILTKEFEKIDSDHNGSLSKEELFFYLDQWVLSQMRGCLQVESVGGIRATMSSIGTWRCNSMSGWTKMAMVK